MASGFTMVKHEGKGAKTVAKASTKKATSKSPAGQKIQAGGSGKMHGFAGAGAQKPGVSATTQSKGKGAAFPAGGPSGKMHGFAGVKAQKSGRSSQS
jgi:hypothetical protein